MSPLPTNPQSKRTALGKGLASLFPTTSPEVHAAGAVTNQATRIPGLTFALVDEISPNPFQPRREFDGEKLNELAQSIKESGVIQPITVRKQEQGYQLIAGERRLRAAKLAGLKQVPVVVRKATDREALELALIENVQRHDLNCIDEALAYQQLMQDFQLTQEEVSQRTGKERSTVANFLRLLRLPQEIMDDLKRGGLSLGHGKVLLSVDNDDEKQRVYQKIKEENLSVRATELFIKEIKEKQEAEKPQERRGLSPTLSALQARIKNLGLEISKSVGLRAELKGSDRRGRLVIQYSSRDELDRLIRFMQNENNASR